jgi:hypothetical protein
MARRIYYICQRCAGTGIYKDGPCPDCNATGVRLFGYLLEKEEKEDFKKD